MKSKFSCQSTTKSKSQIIIPRDILAEICSLPNKNNNQKIIFAPWEDEIIVKYGGLKSLKKIAKILGKKKTAVNDRYHLLLKSMVFSALEER